MAKQSIGGGDGRPNTGSGMTEATGKRVVTLLEQIHAAAKATNDRTEKAARQEKADKQASRERYGIHDPNMTKEEVAGLSRSQRLQRAAWGGVKGVAAGAATGIGTVVSAMTTPHITAREREHMAFRGIASEASAQGAMGVAAKLGLTDAQQMGVGQSMREGVGALMDSLYDPVLKKTGMARQGFGDLEEMAAMGIDVSTDTINQRAATQYEQAGRRYDFQGRMNDALDRANKGEFDAARTEADAALAARNGGGSGEIQEVKGELRELAAEMRRARGTMAADTNDAYRSASAPQ